MTVADGDAPVHLLVPDLRAGRRVAGLPLS
ncbi:hypothetical protein JOE26_001310 [Rhodococcus coprophilus]|nr:hypothetical protein [Rhodococcus coprophilus]